MRSSVLDAALAETWGCTGTSIKATAPFRTAGCPWVGYRFAPFLVSLAAFFGLRPLGCRTIDGRNGRFEIGGVFVNGLTILVKPRAYYE